MSNIDQHDQQGKDDIDAVNRAYRDARESDNMLPPPALDDAIRAAARRAVHAGPQPIGKSWVRQWTPQLAVAAVVVLSVSVVFVSVEERPDLAPAPIQKIALKRPTEAPAAALAPMETKIIQEAVPAPQVKLDTNDARGAMAKKAPADSAPGATDSQFARDKATAFAKQESTTPRMAAPPPSLSAAVTPVAPPVYASPATPVLAAPPASATRYIPPPEVQIAAATPFPGTVADTAATKRKEARADAGATAALAELKSVVEKVEVSGSRVAATGSVRSRDAADIVANTPAKPASPAAMPAPAVATTTAAAPPPPVMKQLAPVPAPTAASPVRALEFDAARRNAQVAEAEAVRAIGEDKYKLADRLVEDQRPGPWLKRMLDMREQGKLKELREEILRFKKRHPDVVLPKTLTELPPE